MWEYAHLIMWGIAIVVFGIVEAATVAVVSIWFVLGSLIALGTAALGAPFWLQVIAFIAVSCASLGICKKMLPKKDKVAELMSPDSVVNQVGVVTMPITPTEAGQVRVDGIVWSARGLDPDQTYEKDERVVVCKREGCFCYVERYES